MPWLLHAAIILSLEISLFILFMAFVIGNSCMLFKGEIYRYHSLGPNEAAGCP